MSRFALYIIMTFLFPWQVPALASECQLELAARYLEISCSGKPTIVGVGIVSAIKLCANKDDGRIADVLRECAIRNGNRDTIAPLQFIFKVKNHEQLAQEIDKWAISNEYFAEDQVGKAVLESDILDQFVGACGINADCHRAIYENLSQKLRDSLGSGGIFCDYNTKEDIKSKKIYDIYNTNTLPMCKLYCIYNKCPLNNSDNNIPFYLSEFWLPRLEQRHGDLK